MGDEQLINELRQALILDQVEQASAWEEGRARLLGHDVKRRGSAPSATILLVCRKCGDHSDGSQILMLEGSDGKAFLRITSQLGITPCPGKKP